jgi:hypothetical protein
VMNVEMLANRSADDRNHAVNKMGRCLIRNASMGA